VSSDSVGLVVAKKKGME